MTDEFALYAKTDRRINKLEEKMGVYKNARMLQSSKASWAFTLTLNSLTGLATMMTVWTYWGEAVVSFPSEWVWPVGWLLSSPGLESGGVSLPVWMALCRTSMKMMPELSLPSILPTQKYSQLTLD